MKTLTLSDFRLWQAFGLARYDDLDPLHVDLSDCEGATSGVWMFAGEVRGGRGHWLVVYHGTWDADSPPGEPAFTHASLFDPLYEAAAFEREVARMDALSEAPA